MGGGWGRTWALISTGGCDGDAIVEGDGSGTVVGEVVLAQARRGRGGSGHSWEAMSWRSGAIVGEVMDAVD